jgi:hypothetical protein
MGWSKHHPVGLIHHSPLDSYRGYTLFTAAGSRRSTPEGDIFATLIDMDGRVCHRWQCEEGIRYGHLLANGNLLVRTRPPLDLDGDEPMGGASAAILELDWDGNTVWYYRDSALHHDFLRLPNGNTLVLLWERIPADLTAMVRGGSVADDDPQRMFGDLVREVAPDGSTVYEWRSWEHLSVDDDVICPLEGRKEWTHANSLAATRDGDLLLSFRQSSVVAIADKATGEFQWKWGRGELSHQHDATYLENGHVMIFDNGSHRRGPSYSRVVEVDPTSDEIAWEYKGDPQVSFYSHNISSAERLPNGNTLMCEGQSGRIFEVTRSGDIVWEYVNPFTTGSAEEGLSNAIFKAHRYGPDHPALAGRDLDPGRVTDVGGLHVGR